MQTQRQSRRVTLTETALWKLKFSMGNIDTIGTLDSRADVIVITQIIQHTERGRKYNENIILERNSRLRDKLIDRSLRRDGARCKIMFNERSDRIH